VLKKKGARRKGWKVEELKEERFKKGGRYRGRVNEKEWKK
jgi:hypothetical protein